MSNNLANASGSVPREANRTAASTGFRRSPTLSLADRVQAIRASGQTAYSLSTPTFVDCGPALLSGVGATSLLMPPDGEPALRELLASGLFGRWKLPDHQLIITAGAKAALHAILRQVTEPGDVVGVVSPRWPTYDDIVRVLGCEAKSLDTRFSEGFRPSVEAFAQLIREAGGRLKALVIANPNNPAGSITSGETLATLHEVAVAHGVLLVLDESFSEVVFDTDAWNAATIAADCDSLAVVNSLSKGFHLQGLRVGACLVPEWMFDGVVSVHQAIAGGVSSLSQAAALAHLSNPENVHHPEDLRPLRDRMLGFIQARGWECHPSQGSFYHFPHVGSIKRFGAALERSGVFFLGGEAFGTPYRDHVRMCFLRPHSELEALISQIEESLNLWESQHG